MIHRFNLYSALPRAATQANRSEPLDGYVRRSTPSPGTPGEGWGEGDLERRMPLVLEITLILAFSRTTGRRGPEAVRTNKIYTTAHR